jgi:hypothetical protein
LNDVGFVWDLINNKWAVMYQRLLMYKKKHGTTRVPKKYKADLALGNWVFAQRKACEKEDRIDLLNEIGFDWRRMKTDTWEVMYQRLLTYKKKYGTTCVSKGYKADPKLGSWVYTQRQYCEKEDRIDFLNEIGFENGK